MLMTAVERAKRCCRCHQSAVLPLPHQIYPASPTLSFLGEPFLIDMPLYPRKGMEGPNAGLLMSEITRGLACMQPCPKWHMTLALLFTVSAHLDEV